MVALSSRDATVYLPSELPEVDTMTTKNTVTKMNALQVSRIEALKTQLADSGYDYKQGSFPWDSVGNNPDTVTLTNRLTVFSCGIECATLSVGKEGFAAVDEACSNKLRRDMHSVCATVNAQLIPEILLLAIRI